MQSDSHIEPIANYRERRKYVRFNEGAMNVWIRRRRFLKEFIKGEPVNWINFNQYGMAFSSTTHLDVHEEILVNVKTTDISLTNLVAVVHNARRQAGTNRYGVQFYFGANSHMQCYETRELLALIEQRLR
mgnify:CR=1 FL=1